MLVDTNVLMDVLNNEPTAQRFGRFFYWCSRCSQSSPHPYAGHSTLPNLLPNCEANSAQCSALIKKRRNPYQVTPQWQSQMKF